MTNTKRSQKKWSILDRKSIAFHEAGHAVVALALGARSIKITLSPHEPKTDGERSFTGQSHRYAECFNTATKAMYGYAGWVAEMRAANSYLNVEDLRDEVDYYTSHEMSLSDRKCVHGLRGSVEGKNHARALEKCLRILNLYWPVVEGLAYELAHDKDGEVPVVKEHLKEPFCSSWRGYLKWD